MKQAMQFTIGVLIGMFVWRFYDLISMAINDGLVKMGVTDPYMQAGIVLVVIGLIIFGFIHGGMRKLLNAFSD